MLRTHMDVRILSCIDSHGHKTIISVKKKKKKDYYHVLKQNINLIIPNKRKIDWHHYIKITYATLLSPLLLHSADVTLPISHYFFLKKIQRLIDRTTSTKRDTSAVYNITHFYNEDTLTINMRINKIIFYYGC
jgi:hypothetical protein